MANKFILHGKQLAAILNSEKEPIYAYVGGIRSGKTITGAHWALKKIIERPKEVGGIFSNNSPQLNRATLKEFIQVLADYGLIEGEHFVSGKNPTPYFGYQSKFDKHGMVWSFANGAQVIVFTLEQYFRGIELGWAWGDEVQDASLDILQVVRGRMSGSKTPRMLWTLTPPSSNPDLDELIYGVDAIPSTIGTTYDNAPNLPSDYIASLEKAFDEITFRREVLAERVTLTGLNWLYAFSRTKHVSDKAAYNDKMPVYVSIDFNNNPFVAVLAHRGWNGTNEYIHYFAEVAITGSQVGSDETYIEALVRHIESITPAQAANKNYFITGDATGRAQSVLAKVGRNMWAEIQQAFRIGENSIVVAKSNPPHQESRRLCNSVFAKHPEVLINLSCKLLIRDCEFVQALPDGSILKGSRADQMKRADALDCMRYDLHTFSRSWMPF